MENGFRPSPSLNLQQYMGYGNFQNWILREEIIDGEYEI
jgi:hypothetical protein